MDALKNVIPTGEENPTPPPTPTPEPNTNDKLIETLQGIQAEMTALRSEWDDAQANPPAPVAPAPATPEPQPDAWAPKSWNEFPEKAKEVAKEVVKEELESLTAAERAEQERIAAESKAIDDEIETATEDLVKKGKLPPVVDPNDPNDQGKVLRRELYGLAAKMDTMNLEMVADTMNQLHKQGVHYDFKSSQWLRQGSNASQNAPVGSSNMGGGMASEGGGDYQVIHKARSLGELARRAGM